MTENTELKEIATPEARVEITEKQEATTPEKEPEILIPVKFNKEIKSLTVEEASKLAQKGLKYEAVSQDYQTLKDMAFAAKQSVPQFLEALKNAEYEKRINELTEKCGGDRDMAEHIIKLEGKNSTGDVSGFDEIMEYFPQISSVDELPEEVVENAELKNRALLDEYLRYCLREKRRVEEAKKMQTAAGKASAGSQTDRAGVINPETAEFLKGLWK